MLRVVVLAFYFGLAASLVGAAGHEEQRPSVKPQHLAPAASWLGPQFLQADKKGQLFLLRGDTWEVYPLSPEGELDAPQRLKVGPPDPNIDGPNIVVGAAMSPEGDWVTHQAFQVRLFHGTQEQAIELPKTAVHGLTLLRGVPIISGVSNEVNYNALTKEKELPERIPFLARWDGDRWEPFSTFKLDRAQEATASRLDEQGRAKLLGSAEGRLWVAFGHRHRIREYSPGGRLLTEIVVGGGEARRAADADARQKNIDQDARRLSKDLGVQVYSYEVLDEPAAVAMAEGQDSRLYFLIQKSFAPGSEMSLERFEPAGAQLERLALPIPALPMATMAAGNEALYIAAQKASQGIWSLPWEDLDAADWQPVEDAEVFSFDEAGFEGAWREKNGLGLVRFDKGRVVTWEEGRLSVLGVVERSSDETLLRRAGFGESWRIARKQATLRIERDGKAREYTRLTEIPKSVSLDPAALGKPKELAPERIAAIRADLEQRVRRAAEARKKADLNVWRLAVADNLRHLRELTAEIGWIDARRFGVPAASHAATLAQDGGDLLLMLAALPFLEKDLKPVPEGAPVYSGFYDALQVALGGKQRYGTQIAPDVGGGPVVLPIESRAQVDPARKKIGLEPLADFLALTSRSQFQGKAIRIAEGEVLEAPKAPPTPVGSAAVVSSYPAQTEAFFAQGLSVKRLWKADAVSPRALASPVPLYFETPAQ